MSLESSIPQPGLTYTHPPNWRELRLRAALERTEALLSRSLEERAQLAARVRELEGVPNGR